MIRHPSRRLTGQDWQVYPSILNEKFARCNVPIARWPDSRPSIALLLSLETFRIGSCVGTSSAIFEGFGVISALLEWYLLRLRVSARF